MAQGHLTSPLLGSILIRTTAGRSPAAIAGRLRSLARAYPGVRVDSRHDVAAREDAHRAADDWLFRVLAAIIFVFAAINVVNTLVMIALHRTRELALLRLIGATSRQVLSLARWEGGIVVALGVMLGGAIALVTLVPTSHFISGSAVPFVPPSLLALLLGSAAAISLLATQLATRLALRPRPVDGIGLRG